MADLDDCPSTDSYFPTVGDDCVPMAYYRDLKQTLDIYKTCLREAFDQIRLLQAGGGGGNPGDSDETQTVTNVSDLSLDLTAYSQCSNNASASIRICFQGGGSSEPMDGAATGTYTFYIRFLCDGAIVGTTNTINGTLTSTGSNDQVCATHALASQTPFQCNGVVTAEIVSSLSNPTYSSFSFDSQSLTVNAFCIN